jgi:hypothetical protein
VTRTLLPYLLAIPAGEAATASHKILLGFEKLDRIAVAVGINVAQKDEQKVIDALKECVEVKMMWRTYGAHNLILVIICSKGDEGNKINKLRVFLEEFTVKSGDMCVGFSWEKMDMTPF